MPARKLQFSSLGFPPQQPVRSLLNRLLVPSVSPILHMILLGIVKYFWGQTALILNKAHSLGMFQTRLESINKDGLNSPTLGADYIVRYKGGLIRRHFKSLAQVMPYLIYDLVPDTVLEGWLVIG